MLLVEKQVKILLAIDSVRTLPQICRDVNVNYGHALKAVNCYMDMKLVRKSGRHLVLTEKGTKTQIILHMLIQQLK